MADASVLERRHTVTITLQVEVDGDDVRGWARAEAARGAAGAIDPAPTDTPRAFAGWLGLIGAIDALLGFAASQDDPSTTREGAQSR